MVRVLFAGHADVNGRDFGGPAAADSRGVPGRHPTIPIILPRLPDR